MSVHSTSSCTSAVMVIGYTSSQLFSSCTFEFSAARCQCVFLVTYLERLLFFSCCKRMYVFFLTDWSSDYGGMRVYVAKDEDEEVRLVLGSLFMWYSILLYCYERSLTYSLLQLLSVSPSSNALSLVFCDKDTISFTKYINHRSSCTDTNFFAVFFIYQE